MDSFVLVLRGAISVLLCLAWGQAWGEAETGDAFPADCEIKVVLEKALVSAQNTLDKGVPLELRLSRRNGRWDEVCSGTGRQYNQAVHEGMVKDFSEAPGKLSFAVEMIIHDDGWVKGGFGRYAVELAKSGEGWQGRYKGEYQARF